MCLTLEKPFRRKLYAIYIEITVVSKNLMPLQNCFFNLPFGVKRGATLKTTSPSATLKSFFFCKHNNNLRSYLIFLNPEKPIDIALTHGKRNLAGYYYYYSTKL